MEFFTRPSVKYSKTAHTRSPQAGRLPQVNRAGESRPAVPSVGRPGCGGCVGHAGYCRAGRAWPAGQRRRRERRYCCSGCTSRSGRRRGRVARASARRACVARASACRACAVRASNRRVQGYRAYRRRRRGQRGCPQWQPAGRVSARAERTNRAPGRLPRCQQQWWQSTGGRRERGWRTRRGAIAPKGG